VQKKNEKLNYIHFNPVKRKLVEKPKGWIWRATIIIGTVKKACARQTLCGNRGLGGAQENPHRLQRRNRCGTLTMG
jgi:hypothetical protein